MVLSKPAYNLGDAAEVFRGKYGPRVTDKLISEFVKAKQLPHFTIGRSTCLDRDGMSQLDTALREFFTPAVAQRA